MKKYLRVDSKYELLIQKIEDLLADAGCTIRSAHDIVYETPVGIYRLTNGAFLPRSLEEDRFERIDAE
jgi:hypothetical protein